MKTFHYVVILEGRKNMDPSSGKNNESFFFYTGAEEEFLFLLYKDLGCRFDKSFLSSSSNMCEYRPVGFIPMLSVNAACTFAFSLT
jgi:hypothetical protein